ncbi:hypothetical protein [Phenylobacterium aquaticum]|uniref:hypothetical protein n=1 Tax=Phenylobacterium aquaticum TaxID=1763816 RepID=UPI001F5D3863|nr:hypothetical protein [Phenylobacterium aquaticum]MCI3132718.1 hypothetical protein [Phenylobacterium aquaticum]
MNKITSTCGALALCLMSAACATHQTARLESRGALSDPANVRRAEVAAVRSAYWGDKWTAANLFERANAPGMSVVDRFNLAATYQATGRLAEAAPLYRSVQTDGWAKRVTSAPVDADHTHRLVRFNLADEATSRLAYIDLQMAEAALISRPAASTIRSAEAAGTPASAIVGTPGRGRISDAAAIARDASIQPLQ